MTAAASTRTQHTRAISDCSCCANRRWLSALTWISSPPPGAEPSCACVWAAARADMDDHVEQLIQAFNARGAMSSPAVKLNVLMDLERLPDGRVVSFLLHVLANSADHSGVGIQCSTPLRHGPQTSAERYT